MDGLNWNMGNTKMAQLNPDSPEPMTTQSIGVVGDGSGNSLKDRRLRQRTQERPMLLMESSLPAQSYRSL